MVDESKKLQGRQPEKEETAREDAKSAPHDPGIAPVAWIPLGKNGAAAPVRDKRCQKRSASQSSESSVTSPSPSRVDLGEQLKLQERLQLKEEKKAQKELMKALETPEEKRALRLAKKEAKERKKREKMGWGEEYMGYTNNDNPFGDNSLLGGLSYGAR